MKPELSLDEIKSRLRGKDLRSTSARIAVVRYLHAAKAPVTHAELAQGLQAAGFDRATVYRNLTDLTHAQLVTRYDLGDHVWRFELQWHADAPQATHPHFVCIECGTVRCLPDVHINLGDSATVPHAIRTSGLEVQLRGHCEQC